MRKSIIPLLIFFILNITSEFGLSERFDGYKIDDPKQTMTVSGPILRFEETKYTIFLSIAHSAALYQFPKPKDKNLLITFLNEKIKQRASVELLINPLKNTIIYISDKNKSSE